MNMYKRRRFPPDIISYAAYLNELVNQKRGVTPSTALRLARFFGVSPDFWLNLQVRWDLYRARESEKDALAEIQDYRHIKKRA